ncbi:acyl-CoA carboxylase subunit epsilon [Rhodococcus yananensis]|uniref:acyl-CoA carboxylase subunit epsilon n=1 Tax=Rhodococcus yananensis TaxID=2879464 RepID=UPI001CF8C26E|nr:acyl-CoA carboxylase subunit epsilon [Rhodococcus yananensis]
MTATTEEQIITDAELDAVTAGFTEDAASEAGPASVAPETTPAAADIRIVKGNPSDVEIAALVSVLATASASAGAPEGDGKPPETWGDPTRMHRQRAPFSPYSYPNLG